MCFPFPDSSFPFPSIHHRFYLLSPFLSHPWPHGLSLSPPQKLQREGLSCALPNLPSHSTGAGAPSHSASTSGTAVVQLDLNAVLGLSAALSAGLGEVQPRGAGWTLPGPGAATLALAGPSAAVARGRAGAAPGALSRGMPARTPVGREGLAPLTGTRPTPGAKRRSTARAGSPCRSRPSRWLCGAAVARPPVTGAAGQEAAAATAARDRNQRPLHGTAGVDEQHRAGVSPGQETLAMAHPASSHGRAAVRPSIPAGGVGGSPQRSHRQGCGRGPGSVPGGDYRWRT